MMVGWVNVFSQVFFADGFEDGSGDNISTDGTVWGANTNAVISTDVAKTGNRSLRFFFEGVADGEDSYAERRFVLSTVTAMAINWWKRIGWATVSGVYLKLIKVQK